MATHPKRVLVADAYRDSADSLAVVLGLHGHETRVVYDGRGAAELIEVLTGLTIAMFGLLSMRHEWSPDEDDDNDRDEQEARARS